jgi:hypothetical protein
VQVTDIEPDSKVRAAMNEINAAQRMRMAAREKAEAEKVMLVTRAEGEPASQLLSSMHCPRHKCHLWRLGPPVSITLLLEWQVMAKAECGSA